MDQNPRHAGQAASGQFSSAYVPLPGEREQRRKAPSQPLPLGALAFALSLLAALAFFSERRLPAPAEVPVQLSAPAPAPEEAAAPAESPVSLREEGIPDVRTMREEAPFPEPEPAPQPASRRKPFVKPRLQLLPNLASITRSERTTEGGFRVLHLLPNKRVVWTRGAQSCPYCGGAAASRPGVFRDAPRAPGKWLEFAGMCDDSYTYNFTNRLSRSASMVLTSKEGESWSVGSLAPGETATIKSASPISGLRIDARP